MDYMALLEDIEAGSITVDKAVKKIEAFHKNSSKPYARKLKVKVKEGGKTIKIPSLSLSVIKVGLRLCPPLLKLGRKYSSAEVQLTAKETEVFLDGIGDFLTLLKEHPPTQLITLKTEDKEVEIDIATK